MKLGLNEAESRTVASFRLVFLTIFGQIKVGKSASKFPLPVIKDYSQWNPHDNVLGTEQFIE